MFKNLKYRKTKEDREKELKKLEKQTVKKMKKLIKEEENYSDEQRQLLKKTKTIIFVYLTLLCLFFVMNLVAGVIFAIVSAPLVYLCFRNKYPQHVKVFPLLSLCVTSCFLSMKGGDLLDVYIKRKNYEHKVSYNENIVKELEQTQNMLDVIFELYELQETDGEVTE